MSGGPGAPGGVVAGAGSAGFHADRTELLAGLGEMPRRVRLAAGRIAHPTASGDPSGGWSATETVGHLAAVDAEVWAPRLRQLAAGEHPRWTWTEPDMTGRAEVPMAAALDALDAGRGALITLADGMDTDAWLRTGTHAVFGELDVAGLLGEVIKHDLEHVEDLERRGRNPAETPDA